VIGRGGKLGRCFAIPHASTVAHARGRAKGSLAKDTHLGGWKTGAMHVVRQEELPFSRIAHEMVGEEHGSGLTILFVDAPPGRGPSLHQHPYEEVFIVQEGEALVTAGDEQRTLRAGDVLIIPPDTPHAFTNTGDGPLRQIDIHVAPSFSTQWLEE
jgi:mannose-6-phosphate isomerase-like protein (cupin superfamily)